MGISFPSIPGLSGIRDTMTSALSSTGAGLRDFSASAVARTAELGSAGMDIGRRAVDAVATFDVRAAAETVRSSIGSATESTREGIRTGTEWAGQQTHRAAEFARSNVTGDDLASRALRGAVTVGENATRFQLGVVGGVTREATGLVGSVGQLGTSLLEMQVSPAARAEYSQAAVDGVASAANATGRYVSSVAADPSRVGTDITALTSSGSRLIDSQLDRYSAAIRDGRGPETIGMDVGTVATYLVPVGGGPLRGAATAGIRGTGEAVARGSVETLARSVGETAVRTEVPIARSGVLGAEAGTIRNVNRIGGDMNCVNCVVATDAMLAGRPASALGGGPFPISQLEGLFGGRFSGAMSASEITRTMESAGPGARGIVFGSRGNEVGHVFNVVNQNDAVRFLDGQIGGPARLDGYSALHLLRTN